MKDNKNKVSTLISLIVIAILMIPIMCFCLGSEKSVSTGWTVEPRVNSSNKVLGEGVILKLDERVDKLYVCIGNVYNAQKINFRVEWSNRPDTLEDGDIGLSKSNFSVDVPKEGIYSWVMLSDKFNINSTYVKITSEQRIELKEVAFVQVVDKKTGEEKQVKASCYGARVFKNNELQFIDAKNDDRGFANVCDEQDAFIRNGVMASDSREMRISSAVENLLSGNGIYVSEYDNVLGVELIALGVLIFGNNSFGLAFMPFLFFVATAFVIFALGKKIFGNSWYGLISSIIYIFSGLSLSLAVKGMAISISAFFVVLSYYFAYNFYKKTQNGGKVVDNVVHVFLAGVMFSLAICVNIQAVVSVFGLLFLTVYPCIKGMVKAGKIYKKRTGIEKEYARENYISVISRGIISLLLAFVLMPFVIMSLSYGFAYPAYRGFYSDSNFFTMMFANHGRILSSAQNSVFIGWIIGLGNEKLTNILGNDIYITSNKGMVIIGLISLVAIVCTYFMYRFKKIGNEQVANEIAKHRSAIEFMLVSFASTFLMLVIFATSNAYETFVYSMAFLSFMPLMFLKILRCAYGKKAFISVAVVMSVVVVMFFALQFPCFVNIYTSAGYSAFYMWLV